LNLIALVIAVITVIGVLLTWHSTVPHPPAAQNYDAIHEGIVDDVYTEPCDGTPDVPCRTVIVILAEGPSSGQETFIQEPVAQESSNVAIGETLLMGHLPDGEPGFDYSIADRKRSTPILWLVAIFAVAVMILGRIRGATALIALAASIAVLALYMIPALLAGVSPLVTALLAASMIAYLSLYLTHGVNAMTTVALLGTIGGLGVTALLAVIFTEAASLTGFASDEAFFVQAMGLRIDIQGMLLAGMIIAGLGVIDDAAVTQAAAIWEIAESRPQAERSELVRRGLRIGRSHVASMVNTLVLAYAGAAMPVFVILAVSSKTLGLALNGEILASEIVRTLVGSIGLILAVPITTFLAARTVKASNSGPGRSPLAKLRQRQRQPRVSLSAFEQEFRDPEDTPETPK